MRLRWHLGLIFVLLATSLTCRKDTLSGKTPNQLANLVRDDLVESLGVMPRFLGSRGGSVCPDRRLPSGGPNPICSDVQKSSKLSQGLESQIQRFFRSPLAASDPEILRLKAFSKLRWGQRPEDRDQAIDLLSLALDLQPASARLHTDLSATLLLRSGLDAKPRDLLEALRHAQRAHQLDPRSAEARANIALALEGLALPREAAGIWQTLLEHPEIGALARSFLNRPPAACTGRN